MSDEKKQSAPRKWCSDVLVEKCEFRKAHFGLAVVDKRGDFVRVNQALAALYGVSMQDLLVTGPLQFSPPEQPDGETSREKARRLFIEALKKGSVEFEWRHYFARDPQRPIDCAIRLTNIGDQDGQKFLAYVEDVSVKKKRAREREKKLQDQFDLQRLENLERLAGGLSHELNNAASAILGNLEYALKQELSPDVWEALDDIRQSTVKITRMMRAVADFARSSMVTMELLNLKELLNDVRILARAAMPDNFELVFEVPKTRDYYVRGSRRQIKSAVLNLILNALDALEKMGDKRIVVALREGLPSSAPGHIATDSECSEYVTISVVDHGCGVADSLKRKIFEPYFTTKALGRGRGLGLSQVQGIAKKHSGAFSFVSEPGRGSSFFLSLPVVSGG